MFHNPVFFVLNILYIAIYMPSHINVPAPYDIKDFLPNIVTCKKHCMTNFVICMHIIRAPRAHMDK